MGEEVVANWWVLEMEHQSRTSHNHWDFSSSLKNYLVL